MGRACMRRRPEPSLPSTPRPMTSSPSMNSSSGWLKLTRLAACAHRSPVSTSLGLIRLLRFYRQPTDIKCEKGTLLYGVGEAIALHTTNPELPGVNFCCRIARQISCGSKRLSGVGEAGVLRTKTSKG